MTHVRRWLFLGLVLLGTQLSTGCYLGYTNRPVLFPGIALSPAYARPGVGVGCGPTCYREFGGGPALTNGPVVTGPVYDGGYPTMAPAPGPGCAGCTSQYPPGAVPIAGAPGGPPIAMSSGGTMVPAGWVPFDSGTVTIPTVKPPAGSVPLQMPSEVKESKKIVTAGK